jgi:uncharacterized protein (TIGR02145 family)
LRYNLKQTDNLSMKTRFQTIGLMVIFSLLVVSSCKKENPPVVKTYETRNIMATAATSGGSVTDAGSGTVTTRGVCWSTGSNPTLSDNKTSDGSGVGDFDSQITGLLPATTYYVRAYATNSSGTGYGPVLSFKTAGTVPKATSLQPLMIFGDGATLSAIVNPCLLTSTVSFEYGQTAGYGNSVDYTKYLYYADQKIAIRISGLTPGTTYHFRVKAVNSLGTSYGDDMIFQTTQAVADNVGNQYNTIVIGSQTWTSRNLETTMFNDSTEIPLVTDDSTWAVLDTPGMCWYNNDELQSRETYGALYNWYAVSNGKLCPAGFHVATIDEWITFVSFLGENWFYYGGYIGMSAGILMANETGWDYSSVVESIGNTDLPDFRNITGFSVLPAGIRDASQKVYSSRGSYSSFWTTTENYADYSDIVGFSFDGTIPEYGYQKRTNGYSIRCLKN